MLASLSERQMNSRRSFNQGVVVYGGQRQESSNLHHCHEGLRNDRAAFSGVSTHTVFGQTKRNGSKRHRVLAGPSLQQDPLDLQLPAGTWRIS